MVVNESTKSQSTALFEPLEARVLLSVSPVSGAPEADPASLVTDEAVAVEIDLQTLVEDVETGVLEVFNDEAAFLAASGTPDHFIDFETYGDGSPVPIAGVIPPAIARTDIAGDEWSNLGVTFSAVDPNNYPQLLEGGHTQGIPSLHHVFMVAGDNWPVSSWEIDFTTPVSSVGFWIVDSDTSLPPGADWITLYDSCDQEIVSVEYPSAPEAHFYFGFISDIAVARVVVLEGSDNETVGFDDLSYTVAGPADGFTSAVPGHQAAAVGFWQNNRGQELILSLNGGGNATRLGDWLAGTFPNMYGVNAGANNLTGRTNAEVAAFYDTLFGSSKKAKGVKGPAKLDTQVLGVALSTYVTSRALAGSAAEAYGFVVTEYGLGFSTCTVGNHGRAFDVAAGTEMTIGDILRVTDEQALNGTLFALNPSLRVIAHRVYASIGSGRRN